MAEYKKRFEKLNMEATKLKIELEKEQETIANAEHLIGKLDGEYQRWNAQVGQMCVDVVHELWQVPGRRWMLKAENLMLVSCACMSNWLPMACCH